MILEAHDSGSDVLRMIERRIGIERLRADRDRAQGIARPTDTGLLDLLIADGGSTGRQLLAAVIESLQLCSTGVDEDELLAAVRFIRQLTGDKRRWLPGFSPSAFIDARWRPHVVDTARGRLDRRAYELCAAYELRTALRAGRVWVPGSRRHADPAGLLLSDEQWEASRMSFIGTVDQPLDGDERLRALGEEQRELLHRLAREQDANAEAQLTDGDLVVDGADTAQEGRLRKLIEPRLPEVDLPEMLIEVGGWTGFTDHLTPLSGNRRRSTDMPTALYAVILAQATNLGLTGMARASEFSQQLEWAWELALEFGQLKLAILAQLTRRQATAPTPCGGPRHSAGCTRALSQDEHGRAARQRSPSRCHRAPASSRTNDEAHEWSRGHQGPLAPRCR